MTLTNLQNQFLHYEIDHYLFYVSGIVSQNMIDNSYLHLSYYLLGLYHSNVLDVDTYHVIKDFAYKIMMDKRKVKLAMV
jgi:hypothetical protein